MNPSIATFARISPILRSCGDTMKVPSTRVFVFLWTTVRSIAPQELAPSDSEGEIISVLR